MWVSQASIDEGIVQTYGLRKRIEAVKNCRTVGKKDMKFNDTMPKMKVDPESYVRRPSTETIPITLTQILDRRSRRHAVRRRARKRVTTNAGLLHLLDLCDVTPVQLFHTDIPALI